MKMTMWRSVFAGAVILIFVAAAVAQDKPAKVAGNWEMSWEGRQGLVTGTLTLEQDGEKLKGTMTGPRGNETPVNGTIKGKAISLSIKRETPRGEFTVEYKGTVDGETMKGTAEMGPRTIEWTAKRVK